MASYSYTSTTGSGANSFQGFKAFANRRPPAINNLYWVRFRDMPKCMEAGVAATAYFKDYFTGNNSDSNGLSYGGPGNDKSRLLTYYANDVTIPSRQITTGDAKTVGSLYRYPTGTTFSEISINFTLPRQLETRMFFERWMNYITEDSGNRVSWYNDSVCKFMDIMKYEKGGINPTNDETSLVSPIADQSTANQVKWNQVTGVWALSNVFPFNISNMQLTNGTGGTMSMEVSFYYERYRFYVPKNTGIQNVPDVLGSTTAATASSQQNNPAAQQQGAQTATVTATANGLGQQTGSTK